MTTTSKKAADDLAAIVKSREAFIKQKAKKIESSLRLRALQKDSWSRNKP